MVIELKIDPEFKSIIAPPTKDERNKLEKSIAKGFDDAFPIIVCNNTIVDGHNRYEFCVKHNVEPKIQEKDFKSRDEALIWIIDRQIQRRNIEKKYWEFLVGERIRIETRSSPGRPKTAQNEPNKDEKTNKQMAKETGLSISTIKRAKTTNNNLHKLADNIKVDPRKVVDSVKNINTIDELAELDSDKANKILEKALKEDKKIEDILKTEMPPTQPEGNEHGALIALPKKVTMMMYKISEDHMYPSEDEKDRWLQCDIYVDDKKFDCIISLKDFKGNYTFMLPNIKNLIIDFSEIFPSLTPIVPYKPNEREYLDLTRSFPIDEWNDFVVKRFSNLLIYDESEKPEESKQEPVKEHEKPVEKQATKVKKPVKHRETAKQKELTKEKKSKESKELDKLAQLILKILREDGDLQIKQLIEHICERNHEKVPEETKAYKALEARVWRRLKALKGSLIYPKKVGQNTFFSVNFSSDNKVDNGVKVSGG